MTATTTVSCVNDDRDFLESRCLYLEAHGHRVLAAETPDAAFGRVPLVTLSGVAAETGRRFDGEGGGLRKGSRLARCLDKPVTGRQVPAAIDDLAGAAAPAGEPIAA